ncbi:MAG TPA: DUF362 domain-containing protein [Flexilinea sp.]|nr:DUF362 domain-containing protein [Flexilinea sp.]HQG89276.1 DUF362 domain-containing protein [Flexilinea sp.]
MEVYPRNKRNENAYIQNDKPLVVKVPHFNGDYLVDTVYTAIETLGGLNKKFRSGDSVIVKPNFNCPDPTPLSTGLDFLAAVFEILTDFGLHIKVGEMCGRAAWPTEEVVQKLKVLPVMKRYGVDFINFEKDDWIPVDISGDFWKVIHVPRTIYEATHRVYLPNMRCHSSARFSGAIKLGVGWLSPEDREIMHRDKDKTEQMIAEINLAFQPDIIIMDGRRSTVGWAGRGDYVYPNVVMASGDMVAIDTEAIKILKQYPSRNRIQIPIDEMKTLTTAQKHGLGKMDYQIIEMEPHLSTREKNNNDPAAIAVMNDL